MSLLIQVQGPLFEAVQTTRVFADCKTFVDCIPKTDPDVILQRYLQTKDQPDFDLTAFVYQHFIIPEEITTPSDLLHYNHMEDHINALWKILAHPADPQQSPHDTLIALPYPYTVPGGRFREIYYWDSYFTSEGLAAAGNITAVVNMVKNFAYLIEHIGHVPNGNRLYYTSRSQPPFFAGLLSIIERHLGIEAIVPFIPTLAKEYTFWMDGQQQLSAEKPCYRRVVRLPDGAVLNRYWGDIATPRPESYREDIELCAYLNHEQQTALYRNLRAACESGWDFSSRWCRDPNDLATTNTTEFIPIDLNALLYFIETTLARYYDHLADHSLATQYTQAAQQRKAAIDHYLWNEQEQFYFDYCWSEQQQSSAKTLAVSSLLFFHLCSPQQAQMVAQQLQAQFLRPGGLVTSLVTSGEQWDQPNGWAPLHWMSIQGLLHYGQTELANTIKQRWLQLNNDVFQRTGKMLEKYNVCDVALEAGGGEYELQDGFGWTNAVALALLRDVNLPAEKIV